MKRAKKRLYRPREYFLVIPPNSSSLLCALRHGDSPGDIGKWVPLTNKILRGEFVQLESFRFIKS